MVPCATIMMFVTLDWTVLLVMIHMLVGSCMECVMTLTDRMFLVTGLSSTELRLTTGQLVLCPYQNRLSWGDGDRPLSSDSEPPGDTETSGPGFGGPFPCVPYRCADTG